MKFFCFPFPWLGHGYASLAIKHLPHWPLCLAHLPHRTRTEWMVERVAFAICFAFACAFFCSAFISTPSFVANPRHSSNSPFHTRESERERAGKLQCPWTSGQLVPACMQLKPTGNCHTRHMRHTQAAAPHRRLLVTLPRAARWTQ